MNDLILDIFDLVENQTETPHSDEGFEEVIERATMYCKTRYGWDDSKRYDFDYKMRKHEANRLRYNDEELAHHVVDAINEVNNEVKVPWGWTHV